jgi:hypothetical protein
LSGGAEPTDDEDEPLGPPPPDELEDEQQKADRGRLAQQREARSRAEDPSPAEQQRRFRRRKQGQDAQASTAQERRQQQRQEIAEQSIAQRAQTAAEAFIPSGAPFVDVSICTPFSRRSRSRSRFQAGSLPNRSIRQTTIRENAPSRARRRSRPKAGRSYSWPEWTSSKRRTTRKPSASAYSRQDSYWDSRDHPSVCSWVETRQ